MNQYHEDGLDSAHWELIIIYKKTNADYLEA